MIGYSEQQSVYKTKAPKDKLFYSEITSIGIAKEEYEEVLRILRNLNRRSEDNE